jgi:putative glycosyltransferase (TIGR04372 family)
MSSSNCGLFLTFLNRFFISFREKLSSFLGLFTALLIIIRSSILKHEIYYSELYANRIGHLAYNVESYLLSKRTRYDSHRRTLLVYSKASNDFLLRIWRRNENLTIVKVFPRGISLIKLLLSKFSHYLSVEKISWELMHPRCTTNSSLDPVFSLNDNDILLKQEKLSRLGIGELAYVSMHNRDSGYLNVMGKDGNYHDFRDYEFSSLHPLINYLSSEGVFSVRHGRHQSTETNKLPSQLLVDISNLPEMDAEDILIVSGSIFFVGCASGFSMVPRLFRKPCLMVNYIPFRLDEVCEMSPNSIFLPKLLYSENEMRFLSFREMAEITYDIHTANCPFSKAGLRVVDNSPSEILDAGVQIYKMLTGSSFQDENARCLQDKFWHSVAHIKGAEESYIVGQRISDSFLSKYAHLI